MNNLSNRPQNKNFGQRVGPLNSQRYKEHYRNLYYNNPKRCSNCKSILPYEKRRNKFCNASCAAKTNNHLPRKHGPEKIIFPFCKIQFCECEICHNQFYVRHHKTIRTKQCRNCKRYEYKSKPKQKSQYSLVHTNTCSVCEVKFISRTYNKYCKQCSPNVRHYRTRAAFKFNIYNYPSEFNLSLIDKHGWYSPNGYKRRNKQPNLSGVSRDHLYSVYDGFINHIDPKLISHPANCQLIKHNGPNGNNKKNSQSSITLEELKTRIELWEQKFGGS